MADDFSAASVKAAKTDCYKSTLLVLFIATAGVLHIFRINAYYALPEAALSVVAAKNDVSQRRSGPENPTSPIRDHQSIIPSPVDYNFETGNDGVATVKKYSAVSSSDRKEDATSSITLPKLGHSRLSSSPAQFDISSNEIMTKSRGEPVVNPRPPRVHVYPQFIQPTPSEERLLRDDPQTFPVVPQRSELRRSRPTMKAVGHSMSFFRLNRTFPRDRQLTLCRNPKSMITVLNAIWAFNREPDECDLTKNGFFHIAYRLRECNWWNFRLSAKPSKNRETNLTYLAVVREPIKRFVSGWIDKCHRMHKGCYGCGTDFDCFVRRNYIYMTNLAKDGSESWSFVNRDHFYPQNWLCDISKETLAAQDIRVMHYSRNSSFYDSLLSLLSSFGVLDWKLKRIESALTQQSTTEHSTTSDPIKADILARIRANQAHLCTIIYKTYAHDYKLLNFPLPNCLHPPTTTVPTTIVTKLRDFIGGRFGSSPYSSESPSSHSHNSYSYPHPLITLSQIVFIALTCLVILRSYRAYRNWSIIRPNLKLQQQPSPSDGNKLMIFK